MATKKDKQLTNINKAMTLVDLQVREHAITDSATVHAYDGQLGYFTTRIERARSLGVAAALSICADLHSVSLLKSELTAAGFKGVGDYAEKTFDYKKSNASAMAAVGKRFLDASGNIKNDVLFGLTWSKLDLIKSLTDSQIQEMIDSGLDIQIASAAEIRKSVRALKAPQKPAEDKTDQKPAEDTKKPEEGNQKPAEDNQKPAEDNQNPADDSFTIAERKRLMNRIAELEMILAARDERIAELETLVRSRDKYIASLQAQYNNHDVNPTNEPSRK